MGLTTRSTKTLYFIFYTASSSVLPDELAQSIRQAESSPQELLHLIAFGAQLSTSELHILYS